MFLRNQYYAAREHHRDLRREAARERMLAVHRGHQQKRKRPSLWSKLRRNFNWQFPSPQEA